MNHYLIVTLENINYELVSVKKEDFNLAIFPSCECFIGISNTEKRVENKMRSGVFLTKFEVFG